MINNEEILNRLNATGLRQEEDKAVPINGALLPLPYMVVRQKQTQYGSDNGIIRIDRTEWTVALFSANRDAAAEQAIARALSCVGKLEIVRYPDGEVYQTNFKFTTQQVVR